jgi:DNA-binding response OmpR family regulator
MDWRQQKILIVDDEDINLDFFDLMLGKLGFQVELARNGKEALEQVARFHPDLIMLDNIMPKMSGWEVTKILKSDPKFREIPIIMLSSMDGVKDKVESFEMGVDDYITKPFNFSEVLARMRAALRTRTLVRQIALREARLRLAETLSDDLSASVADFVGSMDELDALITKSDAEPEAITKLFGGIREKTRLARNQMVMLGGRIEQVKTEWRSLKKNELGLSVTLEGDLPVSADFEEV